MIDLIGTFDLPEDTVFPANCLPAPRYSDQLAIDKIRQPRLSADYADYGKNPNSYFQADGFHLFIVGEARMRHDSAYRSLFIPGLLLPASDLLEFIRSHPDSFIDHLKGNFNLVLVNKDAGRVSLYNSRLAISPFYYLCLGRSFLFSTSLSALQSLVPGGSEIDRVGLAELILFNYPIGDRTYLKNIHMLRPAEQVVFEQGRLEKKIHWDVRELYASECLDTEQALSKAPNCSTGP